MRTAILALLLPALAAAQPACPPPPADTSAAVVYMPAGCVGPGEAFVASPLGYLRLRYDEAARDRDKAGTTKVPARTLPPWAWALIAAAGTLLAPPVACKVGEACSSDAGWSAAGVAGLGTLGAALWLEP